MTLKDRIKNNILARVAKQPLSLLELEAMRRERGGGLHCKKAWLDENIKELICENRLIFAVPLKSRQPL